MKNSLLPVGRQNPSCFVVTGEAMDTTLNQNKPKFGILVLHERSTNMAAKVHHTKQSFTAITAQNTAQDVLLATRCSVGKGFTPSSPMCMKVTNSETWRMLSIATTPWQ